MSHPLPFIKELEDVPKVENLSDVLKVNAFVYSLIYAARDPYNPYTHKDSVESLYRRLLTEEIGGWCGLNAFFLEKLMNAYGVECRTLNYGDLEKANGNKFHVVCIVKFEKKEYLIDPYINKYYCNTDMSPMTFDLLMKNIEDRQMQNIVPVYGKGYKRIFSYDEWVSIDPKSFDERLTLHAKNLAGEILKKKYGSDNTYLLMLS